MTDEPECVVCGAPVKPGERYCGDSCQQADEDDGVDEQIWLPGGSNYTTDPKRRRSNDQT